MNTLKDFNNISLKPIQDKMKKPIKSTLVSIVITNQNLQPMKWIPIDSQTIATESQEFSKADLVALIEEHYISINYLNAAKIFLGITNNNASFTIYKEVQLCKN